jgi:formylglycine-generating enzyme required for sulfatase activity
MSGNAWEWCWDWNEAYTSCCDVSNPKGSTTISRRVARGSGWSDSATNCRVSFRYNDNPYYRYCADCGIRVVCK